MGLAYSSMQTIFVDLVLSSILRAAFDEIELWGPIIFGVLLRLYGLGLWPNDLIRECYQVRGRSTKVVTEIALKEELKVIYESQIYPR